MYIYFENLRKKIWTDYYHLVSTGINPQHNFCDPSWYKYLKATAEKNEFHHKTALN